MITTRRRFLMAIAALPAVPYLPASQPTAEGVATPDLSMKPVYYPGRWVELLTAESLSTGQFLTFNDDGLVRPMKGGEVRIGVALAPLSNKTWQVGI